MANLVQIGKLCSSINGSDSQKLNSQDATLFFKFMATLVDAVPLGTFSTARETAVERISNGGHHTPDIIHPSFVTYGTGATQVASRGFICERALCKQITL
jgi:hypothetical protein